MLNCLSHRLRRLAKLTPLLIIPEKVLQERTLQTCRFYIPCVLKTGILDQSIPIYQINYHRTSSAKASANVLEVSKHRELTAKQRVFQICASVASNLKFSNIKPLFHTGRTKNASWTSTLELKWPEYLKFEGNGRTKAVAEELASKQALQKLQELNALSEDFRPVLSAKEPVLEIGPVSGTHLVTLADLKGLEADFPVPKSTIVNAFRRVCNHAENPNQMPQPQFQRVRKGRTSLWSCSYTLKWPSPMTHQAVAVHRTQAEKWVCLMTIHWLQSVGAMEKKGDPILFTSEEVRSFKQTLQAPLPLSLDSSLVIPLQTLLDDFQDIDAGLKRSNGSQKLSALPDEEPLEAREAEVELEETLGLTPMPYHEEHFFFDWQKRPTDPQRRNEQMLRGLRRREASPVSVTLPIAAQKQAVIDLVERNRVLILTGDTGCGKSTQVPQFILDHWTERNKGAECNIIVTQPRRLAAIALARRIAEEREEKLGMSIGYQIRLESVLPKNPGSILFCSTGILLRKLQAISDLQSLTHIIVDEVHERDVMTDFLLIVLKDVLENNPHLRIILMSASLNGTQLARYFNDAPLIHVPGFVHPVKEYYLPEVFSMLQSTPGLRVAPFEVDTYTKPMVSKETVVNLIRYIDTCKPDGSILCFLPGWQDIDLIYKRLKEFHPTEASHWILPVHSRLSLQEQERIFNPAPSGVRKIVLATNIAETSLTINDVVYVINPGIHKETRYNAAQNTSLMENQWISAANIQQRKGRAGRVQPGECFHLFPKTMLQNLPAFAKAEILRIPLEQVVMDVKTFNPDQKAKDFLSLALDPPPSNAIVRAVSELQHLGALDQKEHLTPLGQRMTCFTTHPRLAKALIYAAIFGCVKPLLSITAWLTSGREPMTSGMGMRAAVRAEKQKYHPTSDHLAVSELLQQWQNCPSVPYWQERYGNPASLRFISGIRRLLAEHLEEAQLIASSAQADNLDATWNSKSSNKELCVAVLLAGLSDRVLRSRKGKLVKGGIDKKEIHLLTSSGSPADIFGESVNGGEVSANAFLCYFHGMQLPERRCFGVRDASVVHPLAVLLFAGQRLRYYRSERDIGSGDVLSVDSEPHLKISCSTSEARLFSEWRRCIHAATDYLLQNPPAETALKQQIIQWHKRSIELLLQAFNSGQN